MKHWKKRDMYYRSPEVNLLGNFMWEKHIQKINVCLFQTKRWQGHEGIKSFK